MRLSSLVLMMFLFSCREVAPPNYGTINEEGWLGYKMNYRIVEADSCEYIMFSMGTAAWGGHREKCKYCQARRNNKPCK